MKIVRVIARMNIGGPARHVVALERGLRAKGHQSVLVHGRSEPDEGNYEEAGMSDLRIVAVADLGRRVSPLSDLRALAALIRIIWRESPDVVHTHTAKAGTLGRLAAFLFNVTRRRQRRCLVVHTFHGHVLSGYFTPAVSRLLMLTERTLAAITDRVITISPSQQRDIVETFRIAPARKTAVVRLGLDLTPFLQQHGEGKDFAASQNIPRDAVVVGYVGRLVPIKNVALLLEAFELVRRQRPDAYLVVAGDGPLRQELENDARGRGVDAFVRFTGWISDLASAYQSFDVCALASDNEGTPVAVIEAMAAGRAVVATDVGGVRDVIDEGRNGVLVPPRDAQALASALMSLINDPGRRRQLGEAARSAAGRFSTDRLVAEVETLYVESLRRKRGNLRPSY